MSFKREQYTALSPPNTKGQLLRWGSSTAKAAGEVCLVSTAGSVGYPDMGGKDRGREIGLAAGVGVGVGWSKVRGAKGNGNRGEERIIRDSFICFRSIPVINNIMFLKGISVFKFKLNKQLKMCRNPKK